MSSNRSRKAVCVMSGPSKGKPNRRPRPKTRTTRGESVDAGSKPKPQTSTFSVACSFNDTATNCGGVSTGLGIEDSNRAVAVMAESTS